jgi:hypothetical protein
MVHVESAPAYSSYVYRSKRCKMMFSANSMSILKNATWRNARRVLALHSWSGNTAAVIVRLKALAPYALIELILPGGSVMALLLWLYRRRKNGAGFRQFPARFLAFLRRKRAVPLTNSAKESGNTRGNSRSACILTRRMPKASLIGSSPHRGLLTST